MLETAYHGDQCRRWRFLMNVIRGEVDTPASDMFPLDGIEWFACETEDSPNGWLGAFSPTGLNRSDTRGSASDTTRNQVGSCFTEINLSFRCPLALQ